jgi:peptide/nickel transport system substrate-binding protein
MKKKGFLSALLIVSFFILIINACTVDDNGIDNGLIGSEKEDVGNITPVRGGTLYLQSYEPDTLNPLITNSSLNRDVLNLIYEGLVKLDENYKPQPCLAKGWEVSNGGTVWVFNLREGIKWHDNTDLTAEDVYHTFQIVLGNKNESIYRPCLEYISHFSVVDDLTFKVVLAEPFNNFSSLLDFPIISARQEDRIEDFKPIGTGPYIFAEYNPLKDIVLYANDNWWNPVPYIDNIIIKLMPDNDTSLYALEVGEVDYVPTNILNWGKYLGEAALDAQEYLTDNYEFIAFNFDNIVLKDISVRRAIAHAIDRKKIVNEVLLEQGAIVDVPIMPSSWLYDSSSKAIEYNKDTAKKILSEAGWIAGNENGLLEKDIDGQVFSLSFELLTNSDNELRNKTAEIIKDNLADIGIDINILAVSWEEVNQKIEKSDFQAVLTGLKLSQASDLSFAFHSGEIERRTNFINYKNPEIDDILYRTMSETDEKIRLEAFVDLQGLLQDELPYVGLCFRTSAVVYNNRIKGNIRPTATNIYNNIHEWYLLFED